MLSTFILHLSQPLDHLHAAYTVSSMLEDVVMVDCEAINSYSTICSKLSIAVAKIPRHDDIAVVLSYDYSAMYRRWRKGGL